MSKVVVFDVDGTLADINHRRHFVGSKPHNWKAFNAGIVNDTPHAEIVFLAKTFFDMGNTVILCSGRGEDTRQATVDQMNAFGVKFHKLFMRAVKDNRKDSIVKVELLAQIRAEFGEPFLWFDDRNQVVDAIRAEGVKVLQVEPGDF